MNFKLPTHSLTSQKLATPTTAKLADIAPIFNLIQEVSSLGSFSNLYLKPRYQTGLALQLFAVWLFGKIRLPSGHWFNADLHTVYEEGKLVGFLLLRQISPDSSNHEIYMCAVIDSARGNGMGKRLIESAISNLPDNCIIEAECLPQSMQMKRLLRRLGFESVNVLEMRRQKTCVEKFRSPCMTVRHMLRQIRRHENE